MHVKHCNDCKYYLRADDHYGLCYALNIRTGKYVGSCLSFEAYRGIGRCPNNNELKEEEEND